ncbi:MAG TPA: hypothetical protein ENJ82_01570 [Bacteroidetes bacterium]|nr:hypothetical protein [Bacteroidota bacterium]
MPIKVLRHGDKAEFKPIFPPTAIVSVKPGKIKATGKSTIQGKKIAVKGDEKSVKVNVDYTAPPFIIPGKGVLTVKKVPPHLLTAKTKSGGKVILKEGKGFIAQFEVKKPAQLITPQGPKKDPMKKYMGFGDFKTQQKKLKAN